MNKYFISDSFESIYMEMMLAIKNGFEFESAPRNRKTYEIINMSFELTNPYNRLVWNSVRDVNYVFAQKFFAWMINGSSDFNYLYESNKNAKNFVNESESGLPKSFSTAYGPRIIQQIPSILKELNHDKDSRRAVIHILENEDKVLYATESKTEFPCTNSFTFFIRNDQLHMHTSMRSNNMIKTVIYDVFNFTMLQEYMLKLLQQTYSNLTMGSYYQNIVSAHVYESEIPLLEKMFDSNTPIIHMKK